MLRTVIAAVLIAAPLSAFAQDQTAQDVSLGGSNHPPQRVRSVMLVGDQKCPPSTDQEIVVCSRLNPDEQYRIPKQFRRLPPSAANNSWVNRAEVVDRVGREAAGLPDTCSVVGSGGQTGCAMQMMREYSADKRARKREQESIP